MTLVARAAREHLVHNRCYPAVPGVYMARAQTLSRWVSVPRPRCRLLSHRLVPPPASSRRNRPRPVDCECLRSIGGRG